MTMTGKGLHSSKSYSVKKNKRDKSIIMTNKADAKKMGANPTTIDNGKRDALFDAHYEIVDDSRLSPNKPNNGPLLKTSLHPCSIEADTPENQFRKIPNLTEEQCLKIKEIYYRRKKLTGERPNLVLYEPGNEASLGVEEATRYPLFFPDIQDFLSHLQGNRQHTRWIHLKKISKVTNVILLCVEGVGLETYFQDCHACPSLSSYRVGVEFVSPLSYGDKVEHCLASKLDPKPVLTTRSSAQDGFVVGLDSLFNINSNRKRPLEKAEKSLDRPMKVSKERTSPVERSLNRPSEASEEITEADVDPDSFNRLARELDIPVCTLKRLLDNPELYLEDGSKQLLPISLQSGDKFSRLDLILTPREMANEKYPLPFGSIRYSMFAKSKNEYSQVRDDSPMFGLDCEMCMTKAGSELTRISIVNEQHEVVYERLVKPYNKIINYLTRYSGITPSMLKDITTRLPDVQCELKSILPSDAILVGQSLNCDLIAMKVMHPYVIDTSVIFNMTGYKAKKTKLKTLCAEFLSESIQSTERDGHDSIEDSLASLKLVQAKLKHSLEWGNACLGYKRTEEESRQAQVTLRDKDATDSWTKANNNKARLAFNAIVDFPHDFLPPSHSKKSLREVLLNFDNLKKGLEKKKLGKRKSSKLCETLTSDDLTECDLERAKKRKVEEVGNVSMLNGDELIPSDRLTSMMKDEGCSQQNTTQIKSRTVTIIGKDEVVDKYRKCLPLHLYSKVQLLACESNSKVVSNVQLRDSQAENNVIIAHVMADKLSKVNKWSKSLLSVCKPNDLICISLNGSRDSSDNRGVFLATVPFLDKVPSSKELINEYLLSQGLQCLL